jgi:hypothetical protein
MKELNLQNFNRFFFVAILVVLGGFFAMPKGASANMFAQDHMFSNAGHVKMESCNKAVKNEISNENKGINKSVGKFGNCEEMVCCIEKKSETNEIVTTEKREQQKQVVDYGIVPDKNNNTSTQNFSNKRISQPRGTPLASVIKLE